MHGYSLVFVGMRSWADAAIRTDRRTVPSSEPPIPTGHVSPQRRPSSAENPYPAFADAHGGRAGPYAHGTAPDRPAMPIPNARSPRPSPAEVARGRPVGV